MKSANLQDVKTNLYKLVELVVKGEEVIICKDGKPIAKLVPFVETKKPRKGGPWKGKVTIAEDFDVLPQDFIKYFE